MLNVIHDNHTSYKDINKGCRAFLLKELDFEYDKSSEGDVDMD